MSRCLTTLILMAAVVAPGPVSAADALVAVAANFTPVAGELKRRFEVASAHRIQIVSGSTGKLYAQIRNGAPFDALLAADQYRPARLEEEGYAVTGSRFTYAVGRLAVWAPAMGPIDETNVSALLAGRAQIAVANPDLAPYGTAAFDVFDRLGLTDRLGTRLATAENVAQAYAMVASGAAQVGLVAWSHVTSRGNQAESWLVPASWHTPILQDVVLLKSGAGNAAVLDFLAYLKSGEASGLIELRGYAGKP